MTRRTTVITPTTQIDALYELPSQPFKRNVISASIYGLVIAGAYHQTIPELKIADVEGNVLFAVTPTTDLNAVAAITPINYLFAELGGSSYTFTNPVANPVCYVPTTISADCCVPESNLFSVTLFGSLVGDTIPNLVLVTEDYDEEFLT